jgi:hypothetical protein
MMLAEGAPRSCSWWIEEVGDGQKSRLGTLDNDAFMVDLHLGSPPATRLTSFNCTNPSCLRLVHRSADQCMSPCHSGTMYGSAVQMMPSCVGRDGQRVDGQGRRA